ncbi:MAG: hypothetical protein AB8B86_13045 [Pseudomonadales bacterium]
MPHCKIKVVAICALLAVSACKEKDEEQGGGSAVDQGSVQESHSKPEASASTAEPGWEDERGEGLPGLGQGGKSDTGAAQRASDEREIGHRLPPAAPQASAGAGTGNGPFGGATESASIPLPTVFNDGDYDVDAGLEDSDFDVGISVPGIGLPSIGLPGMGLPGGGSSGGMGAPSAGLPGGSGGVGGLDDALDASLEDFDGVVLAGKDGARGMENSGAGSSSSGAASSGKGGGKGGASGAGGGQGGGQSRIPPPPSESESSSGGSGGGGESAKGAKGGPRGSNSKGKQPNPAPADLQDGDDDDLIARQIREAAENEEDPELQEKLWDEYRKYKNGQR